MSQKRLYRGLLFNVLDGKNPDRISMNFGDGPVANPGFSCDVQCGKLWFLA